MPELGELADKLNRLFSTVRSGGQEYSNSEVARACAEFTGETFSPSYLGMLRKGQRRNPTMRHLEALASFFDVPASYFFDDDPEGRAVSDQLALLAALRDVEVRQIALRATNLSPEGRGMTLDMMKMISERESRRAAESE